MEFRLLPPLRCPFLPPSKPTLRPMSTVHASLPLDFSYFALGDFASASSHHVSGVTHHVFDAVLTTATHCVQQTGRRLVAITANLFQLEVAVGKVDGVVLPGRRAAVIALVPV